MDMLRSRYEQMYEISSKLQTAMGQVHQHLQKLIKLSNQKPNRLILALKTASRKQSLPSEIQQTVEFEQEEGNQENNEESRQDQSKNEPKTDRTQIQLVTNTNNKINLIKSAKGKPKIEIPKFKAPLSPFFLFMKQKRDIVKQQYPELPPNHIAKIFGKLWKSLTPEQRKPYNDCYARSQSNYMNFVAKIGHKIDDS